MIDKLKSKNTISDEVKYAAKLLSRATLSFLKINLFGQIAIAILCIITIVVIISKTFNNGGGPVHTNGQAAVLVLFAARPISFGLSLITILGGPFLLFTLGNKYVMFRTINRLIADKGEQLLFPMIDRILNKVKANQPQLFQKGTDKAKLQLKILQEIRDSKENKWFKKIISYGFKKVELDEIDFRNENVSFTEILKNKIIDKLKDISEPSRLFFYLILGWQTLILLLTVFKVI
ncbi:hypothetical protein IX39_03255 [Chryseobacterium formosense]|uniref:Uncharacterized protein n=1 Tax=Chryseobacterium formosense TaxID=236814 RepID=A0A085Z5I3_9FLAO|nr:hypothetical protein [Chryseobacterium formosense]KFE99696.1 hypothetical protein IX39_03255 [Chryseobacterium formosense]SFT71203.1 hypothetical protein SAMN05421857_2624 [Chryseobacterium formosense]